MIVKRAFALFLLVSSFSFLTSCGQDGDDSSYGLNDEKADKEKAAKEKERAEEKKEIGDEVGHFLATVKNDCEAARVEVPAKCEPGFKLSIKVFQNKIVQVKAVHAIYVDEKNAEVPVLVKGLEGNYGNDELAKFYTSFKDVVRFRSASLTGKDFEKFAGKTPKYVEVTSRTGASKNVFNTERAKVVVFVKPAEEKKD